MPNWEYVAIKGTLFSGWEIEYADRKETVKTHLTDLLNRLGSEGWELVSVTSDQMGTAKKLFLKRTRL